MPDVEAGVQALSATRPVNVAADFTSVVLATRIGSRGTTTDVKSVATFTR